MNNDKDTQFLCKDCARFNLCQYYDRRKGDSYICKYFHLTETYGMTNGEVIQTLFPDINVLYDTEDDSTTVYFPGDFWNKPYQKGGEEE